MVHIYVQVALYVSLHFHSHNICSYIYTIYICVCVFNVYSVFVEETKNAHHKNKR